MKKISLYFKFIILFVPQIINANNLNDPNINYLKKYFHEKKRGNYNHAINYIYKKTLLEKENDSIIADIFRLNEAIQYPEQIENVIPLINKLIAKFSSNIYINNVLNNLKINYLLISGKLKEADKIKKNSGFVNSYKFLGPFIYNREKDFRSFKIKKQKISKTNYYRGKKIPVKWEKIQSNRKGNICISDFYNSKESFYIFNTNIKIKKTGKYNFLVGKTGFFKINLNDKEIFFNNLTHHFFPGQYIITLFLEKGIHTLQIYSGENLSSKNTFSIQIYDNKNIPYKEKKILFYNQKKIPQANIINIKIVPQIIYSKNLNSNFNLGYNLLSYGLNSDKNLAANILSSIKKTNCFYSEALYYLGLIDLSSEKKEYFWKECLRNDSTNIECLEQLAKLKIDNKNFFQANNYISLINKTAPFSIINHRINIYQYISLGWETEALKKIKILNQNYFKSAALLAKIQLYSYTENLNKLINNRIKLSSINYYNYNNALQLVKNIKYHYIPEKQLKFIENFITIFPEKIALHINAAETLFNLKKYKKTIMTLTAAEKLAPNNAKIQFLLGKSYRFLKKNKLAKYYIKKAILLAPHNKYINDYYDTFFRGKNILEKNSYKENITKLSKLANKYKKEPAITLLNEKIINVLNDGSFYKKTKLIYKIFNPANIDDLKFHQIFLDAKTDELINLKCTLISNGNETECGQIFTRFLSDPNSKLYYNLYAKIISLPKLPQNAILKIEYLVHSKQGQIMKGYFGDKIFYNDNYRILFSKTTLIYPESKKIYAKTYNIKNFKLIEKKSKLFNIYNLQIQNLPPKKKEKNMIPFFNRVPSISFSSFKNWDNFFVWYSSLLKPQIILDNNIKNEINNLVKDTNDDIEKIRLIYTYITNRIRYVGFEIGLKKLQPRRTDITFHSRLGDCKDIAILLMTIFREMGFKSKLVLLRTASDGWADTDLPYAGNFNHAICYVDINGGLYLDGTVKNADIYDLPDDNKNRNVLVLDEKNYSFQYINESKYNKKTDIANTDVIINKKGNAVLHRKLIKTGSSAIITRQEFDNIKEKQKNLTLYWNEKYPGAKISNLKIDQNDLKKPVIYSYKINIPKFINIKKDEILLPASLYTADFFKNFSMLKKRENDFFIYNNQLIKQKTIYKIPLNFRIKKIPENKTISYKKNYFKFKFKTKNNSIIVETETNFSQGIISTVDYKKFRQFLKDQAKKELDFIFLKKL